MLTGGCCCGRIRYTVRGTPFDGTLCHCADCRRVAAAPIVAWFSAATADFSVVAGEPKRFAFSPKAERAFCAECGTPLTYQAHATPTVIDITTCSLDEPERVPPQDQVMTNERLAWIELRDGLRSYPLNRTVDPVEDQ